MSQAFSGVSPVSLLGQDLRSDPRTLNRLAESTGNILGRRNNNQPTQATQNTQLVTRRGVLGTEDDNGPQVQTREQQSIREAGVGPNSSGQNIGNLSNPREESTELVRLQTPEVVRVLPATPISSGNTRIAPFTLFDREARIRELSNEQSTIGRNLDILV